MKNISLLSIVGALAAVPMLGAMSAPDNAPCVCFSRDLIGMKVISASGENLGKIEDVVVQPGGEVAYGVLSFGGVLGMGDKLFAIPWNVLESNKSTDPAKKDEDQHITLPVDKERLKQAPGFDKAHWPTLVDPDWARDIDSYYASFRRPDSTRPIEAGARLAGAPIWKASELKGFNVETPQGDKLGDISDVAFDTNGHVSYVVLSAGGFLGINDRLVPVPWDALRITRDGEKGNKKKIVLPVTKERLEQAPQFKDAKDERARMCDPVWIGKVYEYFSVRPYWNPTATEVGDSMNGKSKKGGTKPN